MAKVQDILNYMNELYPLYNAESFDIGKVGLQFGNPEADVTKIVLCLDVTEEVINKAILNNANLIIAHHPFMFSPLVNLDYRTNFGQKLLKVFKLSSTCSRVDIPLKITLILSKLPTHLRAQDATLASGNFDTAWLEFAE